MGAVLNGGIEMAKVRRNVRRAATLPIRRRDRKTLVSAGPAS